MNERSGNMKTTVDKIRDAIHEWYRQEFAHTGGYNDSIDTKDNTDVFTGLYDYHIEVTLKGVFDEVSYTMIDTTTNEFIKFGPEKVEMFLANAINNSGEIKFDSELLDSLYDEFVGFITDPDYDVYHEIFNEEDDLYGK
jgi:hypothetical protein